MLSKEHYVRKPFQLDKRYEKLGNDVETVRCSVDCRAWSFNNPDEAQSLFVRLEREREMLRSQAMTIGHLSRRSGVPIKVLRKYEDLGFLYTLGRSESNYCLFGEEALWCVQVVQGLRSLGLTLKELQTFTTAYLERSDEPVDALLEEQLAQALARIESHISTLQALRQRILEFQAAHTGRSARPEASALAQLLAADPRRGTEHPPS